MATFTDGFEDLAVGNHGSRIDRPEFTLEVPSAHKTTLEAVKDPLSEIKPGVWVKYEWGSHSGEFDELTLTLKRDNVHRVWFVNYRTVAAEPCRFYDADGRQLGCAVLPIRSEAPVFFSSGMIAIKTIKVSVAAGPGPFIAFDDVMIETL